MKASDEHLYSGTFVISYLKLKKIKKQRQLLRGDGGEAREVYQKVLDIDWFELDPEVVDVCTKSILGSIGNKATKKNSVKCIGAMYLKVLKKLKMTDIDKIFVDLNDLSILY